MNVKVIIGVVIAIAVFFIFKNHRDYDPLYFNNSTFNYVESTNNSKVSNHFFTPDGIDVKKSSEVIQITDVSHPELTKNQVNIVRNQIMTTMDLQPINGRNNRYFGMFDNRHPIYAIERNSTFIFL